MFIHLKTFFTHKQSIAVGSAFILLGLLFGTWATMIPSIKAKYTLTDAQLGLLLLFLPIGAMLFNPFSAMLIQRFGMKNMTFFGMIILSICYALPIMSPYLSLTAFGLFLTGVAITSVNVAMNTCASGIESHYRISIMSTQHGMFSVGLMLGSFVASTSLGAGIDPKNHMATICVIGIVLAFLAKKNIYEIPEENSSDEMPKFKLSFPSGALLLMVIISLCINMTEGAMADWTAVYLDEVVRASQSKIGWGFAAYSMMMATGRFLGDGIIPALGRNKVLIIGSILSILGISIALFFASTISSVIGFGLVGIGVSCGAPILYGSSSKVPGMSKGEGLATMNTFAMAGFMLGPVILGFISTATSLPMALSLLILLGLVWLFFSNKVQLYG